MRADCKSSVEIAFFSPLCIIQEDITNDKCRAEMFYQQMSTSIASVGRLKIQTFKMDIFFKTFTATLDNVALSGSSYSFGACF